MDILFKKGLKENLPSTSQDGTFYITEDTKEIFLGINGNIEQLGKDIISSDTEPVDAKVGTLWIDTSEDSAEAGTVDYLTLEEFDNKIAAITKDFNDKTVEFDTRITEAVTNMDEATEEFNTKIADAMEEFDTKSTQMENNFNDKAAQIEANFDEKMANIEDQIDAKLESLGVDPTLTLSGQPADAKVTGDGLRSKPGLSVSNKTISNYCDMSQGAAIIPYEGGDGAEIFNAYDITNLTDIPVILNKASGIFSHAEGYITSAEGNYSHAEGSETKASGDYSHVEGHNSSASGQYSHSEGFDNSAIGESSHAEGESSHAVGDYSHAEGLDTKALGSGSHTEGYYTIASGEASHAEGWGTQASGDIQHVEGKYNIIDPDSNYLHILGNGGYDTEIHDIVRSNAHTIDQYGNAWYAGDVYVGSASTTSTNKDEGSKRLISEAGGTMTGPLVAANGNFSVPQVRNIVISSSSDVANTLVEVGILYLTYEGE